MRGRAHARTIFTGFGVTGSMLAAVGVTFLVASGILAFDRWPGDLVDPRISELAVSSAPVGSVTPVTDTIALPAASPAVPGGSVAPGAPRQGPGPEGPAGPDGPPPTGPVPAPPVSVPPAGAAGGSAGTSTSADNQLAAALETTTAATADTIRSVGGTLPIASPVTDLVGGLVDGTGQSAADALRTLDGDG